MAADDRSRPEPRATGTLPPGAEAARLRRYHRALLQLVGETETLLGDRGAALRRIANVAARTLGVERVTVWTFDRERGRLRGVETYELSLDRHSPGSELRRETAPDYMATLERGEDLAVEDVGVDARLRGLVEGYLAPLGVTSVLDAPIRVGREIAGLLRHEHVGVPRTWSQEERDFARAMADLASLAWQADTRRLSQTQEHARATRLATVCEIAQLALSGADAGAIRDRAAERVAESLQVELSCICATDPGQSAMRLVAGKGWRAGTVGRAVVEATPGSMGSYVGSTRGALITPDLANESRFQVPGLLRDHGAASGVAVAIGEGATGGLLGAYGTSRRSFGPDEVQFLEGVASILASAADRAAASVPAPTERAHAAAEERPAERLLSRVRQVVRKTREVTVTSRSQAAHSARVGDAPASRPQAPGSEAPVEVGERPGASAAADTASVADLTLPPEDLTSPPAETTPPPAEPTTAPAASEEKRPRGRVLLAEPAPEVQQAVSRALVERRFEVVLARDGQSAVEEALIADRTGQPFRVVLLDVQLPVVDGYSAARRLREQGYGGPLIAITDGSGAERVRSLGAGFNDCTPKPVSSRELIACIKKQLTKRRPTS